ncbi:LOW QUALITY PROTEIN: disks large homolog 5-like [Uloborus diversus]|uniref:LOW QUALITY PROTEIN: disks large homolog 5-like n=1 Tax=Uloborus diversus TaxID=327109 RepID=UPI0024090530|nr:LOW QUALITY PROTEIN: disks large homolog 5-like [Uloborus diversus]
MDEKHKELLKFHRTRFLQCVDIDRLIPHLQSNGVLSNDDVTDLRKYTSSGAKAEKLLDLLPSKGSQAFQAFCLALENTYPHLLTVMFLSGNKKMSGMNDDLRSSPSSAPQSLCSHQDADLSQNILKTDLHVVNSDREVWRRNHSKLDRENSYRRLTTSGDSMISSLSTLSKNHGVSTSDHSLNSNREYESVHPINDTHHRYTTNDFLHKQESSLREPEFYHSKQKGSSSKVDDQRHETIILKKQYNELLADKLRLEQEIERLKRFREEDRKEVNELQRQQQEMLTENGGEAAHQLYLTVVRKCEAMKEEYDNLHKRYADLVASHSASVSKLEVTQEELSCWRKRYEDLAHERNAAMHERNGLQQQCTAAIRQWDNALRERNEAREQLAKVQQQRDEAMKEINQAMAVRIKATKDLARLTEERNAAVQEYSLIMSERDTVHKEMERLQEELNEAQKKIKSTEGNKKANAEEVETLRREISSVLQDRDHVLKECNELREKYGDYVTGREEGSQREKDWRKCESHWDSISRESSRKERENQWQNSCDGMIKTQWLDDLDQANSELESLRRQVERLQAELLEAQQEAEVCKRRRDWAFSERDKIVLERESIRSLCDKLRKERDRAVSDLAEALRDSDDVKRQKNETSKELKELREKIEAQQEKESRMKQLNSVGNNHSRDSAIDADMQEWDTETVEVALKFSSEDELGLELGGGKSDNQNGNENPIFIRNIAKGSKAEGKLKINDCIVKINNIDVSNVDRKTAIEAIKNCNGTTLLVVKRRKMTNSRGVNNVILSVHGGKHHGLAVENGVYISRITPGSVAAREGSIAVGDRLLSINGKSIESVKSASDLLDLASSTLTLQVSKCIPCPSSPPSSVSNYQNSDHRNEKKTSSPIGNRGRDSIPSSPDKDVLQTTPKKPLMYDNDSESSIKSPGSQAEHSKKSPDLSPLSPITRRRKAASDDRTRYPSSQPTLLDRAYNKIFGEKRTSKDKKSSPTSPHSSVLGHEEEDPIAELDSVLEVHSKMLNKSVKESAKKPEKNGGTWPKYKGPLIQYSEVGTVARYPSRKKSERKSLAMVNKQFSLYDPTMQCSKQTPESPMNHLLDDCSDNENGRLSVTMNSDRISVFVDCQHGHPASSCSKKSNIPIISPSASNTQTSSSGSSYASPDISSPHKTSMSGQSNEQLSDIRLPYNGNSSPSSLLDYSVVSAYPNKDVLEYYKNRNRARPQSAMFGVSDSDCLSSLESNSSSQCGKNLLSLGVDRTSFSHSVGMPLSFSSPDRPLSARSGHMYPVTVPTSITSSVMSPPNLLRSSTPFYTLSTGQRGITHSHHPHNHTTGNHGNALVVSPLPSASRYSSPPGLSVYTSRSGDSLLSVSATESMLVDSRSFHTHADSGRYSLKDSSRHSFTPSPSPCPSQYSYSNPSPTQSIDLHYHHNSSCQTPKRVVPAHVHTVYREDSYGPSSVTDGLLTYPKRTQRIRIPSNPSVTSKSSAGKVSSSSIEKASSVSERSSPLPPFTVEWQNPDGSQALDLRGRIPKPGDLRSICIEKSSEPLGIQISCGAGGGIFVSSVTKNSLAAQAGLQIGDHLLEVCGINMRSATYGLAANVLRQCIDSITMLVQYNPEKFREVVPDNEDSSDAMSPCETPVMPHKMSHMKSIDASNEDVPSAPSSAASTLTKKKAGHSEKRNKSSNPEARLVILKKATSNLGISLLGGNAVGIFVHALQDDSPAQGPNGLRTGDQILEYNGIDLRHATAEEAAYELAKPADTVKILALHNMEKYQAIQDQPGDSFYIRAMFDRMSINGSLTYQKDDILYVDNTMYNGVPGLWQAWLVDEEGEKIKCGFIPSKYKVEEELLMKRSIGDLEGAEGGRRGSTAARRSFFRRKRHHRSHSREGKELASFSDVSINSCSDLGEELLPPTYQRVQKKHYESLRPVIVVGPLMEAVVDQLEQDFPHVFQRCIPEKMKGSLSMMERGLQELKFVDFRRRGNHFECTTVTAIKQLCDKNCHALLDCSLSAVERLNQCMIYPIVIFLKYKSTKQIREVKDSRYLTEKVTTKAAKEMFEHALKIESEYKQLINAVIPGSNLAYMCTQVKSCVEEEQSKALWVPSGSL